MKFVHNAIHHGHARHLHLVCEHQMLCDASADVVAGDHNRSLVPESLKEA